MPPTADQQSAKRRVVIMISAAVLGVASVAVMMSLMPNDEEWCAEAQNHRRIYTAAVGLDLQVSPLASVRLDGDAPIYEAPEDARTLAVEQTDLGELESFGVEEHIAENGIYLAPADYESACKDAFSQRSFGEGSQLPAPPELLIPELPYVETFDASPEEAYCSGVQYSRHGLLDGVQDPEWHRALDEFSYRDCMQEAGTSIERMPATELVDEMERPAEWFFPGCLPLGQQHAFELGADREFAAEIAWQTCLTPFRLADDMDTRFAFTAAGVCYVIDFLPSKSQRESGLVPCGDER